MKRTLTALAVLGFAAGSAWAQSNPAITADLWTSEVEPVQANNPKLEGVGITATLESLRSELDVDTDPSVLEDAYDLVEVLHNIFLVSANYTYKNGNVVLAGHAGIGFDRVSVHIEDNGNGSDQTFDAAILLDFGGDIRLQFNRFDISAGLGLRILPEAEVETGDNVDATYSFFRFRVHGEAGYAISNSIRGYAGIHFTMYASEYEADVDGGLDYDWEGEYDIPFGIHLGIEATMQNLVGRVELSVIDANGFLVSLGWHF
jgi:hypothetical protein